MRFLTTMTLILGFQILGLSSLAMASDPIIGTWRLNLSESKFSPTPSEMAGPAPKLYTETYREIEGLGIESRPDGSSTSGKLSWPKEGGAVKVETGPTPGLSYVEALVAPGEWLVITMRDGRQIGTRRKVVSKDRKTMRQTVRSLGMDGKPIEQVEVYDRQ